MPIFGKREELLCLLKYKTIVKIYRAYSNNDFSTRHSILVLNIHFCLHLFNLIHYCTLLLLLLHEMEMTVNLNNYIPTRAPTS